MHATLFRVLLLLGCIAAVQPAAAQAPALGPFTNIQAEEPAAPGQESAPAAPAQSTKPVSQGLQLPEGDTITISIGTKERFTVAPYKLYDAPRSTREEIATVDLVRPPGEPPTRLPDSFIITTNELVGATHIVLPLVKEGEAPFERRIEVLVIDEISAAYKSFLDAQIKRIFPTVAVEVMVANQQTAVLSGFVDKAELVEPIEQLVRGFLAARTGAAPAAITVANAIRVTGSQTVQLRVVIAEVNRSRMRDLGFDFAWTDLGSGPLVSTLRNSTGGLFTPATNIISNGLQTINPDIATGNSNFVFTVTRQGQFAFNGFMRALEANQLGKILAKPVLVTHSGQPAYFNSGGQVPILLPQGNGTISIDYRDFGTNLRFVPYVLGNGRIRVDLRPEVSERNDANGVLLQGTLVPGFTTRVAETTVELESGQTFAIAGLLQSRVVATTTKLPFVGDLPLFGAFFQNKSYVQTDTELLIMVTPHLVDALDEAPCKLPGRESRIPNAIEWYLGSKFEPPCFEDPYRNHWQNHLHHGPQPPHPTPVGAYDNYGRPMDVMTQPTELPYGIQQPAPAAPQPSEAELQPVPTEPEAPAAEPTGEAFAPQAPQTLSEVGLIDDPTALPESLPLTGDPEDELIPPAPAPVR